MAKMTVVKEIPMESLVIGKGQVRVRDVGKEIDDLAESIRKMGLLEPIVVCPAEEEGKYEILTGQRRFLAHRQLGKEVILAGIINERVSETEAKVISVTENLVRRDPNSKDYIDACTSLYRLYGSIKAVCEETGLPQSKVALYVKYDRLHADLKSIVDSGEVELKVALRAQDAASASGIFNKEEALKLARELSQMSGAQQTKVVKTKTEDPSADIDEIIEKAKTGEKITQIMVTISSSAHQSLKSFANDEQTSMDDAAASLIMEGLTGKGYMG